jgi:hypothetical protein
MARRTILVCPMDWGLGHASRCIPVIRAFRNEGCRVIVACSGPGSDLIRRELRNEIPRVVPFPGFRVSYSRSFLFGRLAMQMPEFIYHMAREKKMLAGLVGKHKPCLVVSDNRYGLVHESVPSVLITHQLKPSLPNFMGALEKPLSAVIRKWAAGFDECWIPDFPDNPAAGDLTRGWDRLPRAYFTGWLSRFQPAIDSQGSCRYQAMFILSGPEPHRSILEEMIIEGCGETGAGTLLVRGIPGTRFKREIRGSMEIVSCLESAAMLQAIRASKIIICRSGYSSVMDMLVLGRQAVLIPTPGQTEQEYLGRWLGDKGWFRVVRQKDISSETIREMQALSGRDFTVHDHPGNCNLLEERVQAVLRNYAG